MLQPFIGLVVSEHVRDSSIDISRSRNAFSTAWVCSLKLWGHSRLGVKDYGFVLTRNHNSHIVRRNRRVLAGEVKMLFKSTSLECVRSAKVYRMRVVFAGIRLGHHAYVNDIFDVNVLGGYLSGIHEVRNQVFYGHANIQSLRNVIG